MKQYLIGIRLSENEFKEYGRTKSVMRAKNAKARFEKVYKKKFVILAIGRKDKI